MTSNISSTSWFAGVSFMVSPLALGVLVGFHSLPSLVPCVDPSSCGCCRIVSHAHLCFGVLLLCKSHAFGYLTICLHGVGVVVLICFLLQINSLCLGNSFHVALSPSSFGSRVRFLVSIVMVTLPLIFLASTLFSLGFVYEGGFHASRYTSPHCRGVFGFLCPLQPLLSLFQLLVRVLV